MDQRSLHRRHLESGLHRNSYGGRLGTIFANYDFRNFRPDYVPAEWVIDLYDSNDLRVSSFFKAYTTGYSHGLTCHC